MTKPILCEKDDFIFYRDGTFEFIGDPTTLKSYDDIPIKAKRAFERFLEEEKAKERGSDGVDYEQWGSSTRIPLFADHCARQNAVKQNPEPSEEEEEQEPTEATSAPKEEEKRMAQ